jgi:hypothetical protein
MVARMVAVAFALRVWAVLLLLLVSGCTDPSSPTPSPTATAPATSSAPIPSGPAFDAVLWAEPDPPRADKIAAVPVGEWQVHVTGQAGSVRPNANVAVSELGAGRGTIVRSNSEGGFDATVTGAEGGTIMVGTLSDAALLGAGFLNVPLKDRLHQVVHAEPSTYVRVPFQPPADLGASERAFAATSHFPDSAPWKIKGATQEDANGIHLRGTLLIKTMNELEAIETIGFLSRVFDEDGAPIPEQGAYATSALTPSGLPLEGETKLRDPTATRQLCTPRRETPTSLRCDVDLVVPKTDLPGGGYVLRLFIPHGPLQEDLASPPADLLGRGMRNYQLYEGVPLAFFDWAASDPRPAALLLVDAPAQGARGVQALEDIGTWGWTNRILWQPARHILPRTDATGAVIPYTLEPYLPQVQLADRDSPGPPLLDLVTPGGSWTVTIEPPEGAAQTIGPATFQEIVSRTATRTDGHMLNEGGGGVSGVARLATLDDAFAYSFTQDGLHRIRTEGHILDIAGNTHQFQGTYEVLVAEPMDLDLGTLPGTPLVVGEPINRAIQVHPPVPAEITYRLRAWTGPDARPSHDTTTTGTASRFGWFHDQAHHPSTKIEESGEYRVDIEASYTDPSGRLWAASVSFGGVIVDPADALEVHGRRGIDLQEQDLERFRRSQTGIRAGGNHFNFPYHAGDVAWQTKDDSMEVRLTVGDPDGSVARWFTDRSEEVRKIDPADDRSRDVSPASTVATRFANGQGALYRTTANGWDPRLGAAVDRHAYFYGTVERPGVRVREAAKEDMIPNGYWRFGETYSLQPGMGPQGDLPNDYKFLFGGAVLRVPGDDVARTGGYAALWVEIDGTDTLGSRVDSPFAPGATSILKVPGKEIRAFYEPTGIRPGSLLVEGDMADLGGYLVPLGVQTMFVNVTSPGGTARSFTVESNPFGHLHDTRLNFVVDEPGLWRVDLHVRACPPAGDAAWPCVDGGLNDGAGEFVFYVASRDASAIDVAAPAFLLSGGTLDLASDLAASGGHATSWMPGWLIDARSLSATDPVIRYRPQEAAAKLPNFDMARSGSPTFRSGYPDEQVTFTALVPMPDGSWRGVALDTWGARVLAPAN